jgi:hypothetical protein
MGKIKLPCETGSCNIDIMGRDRIEEQTPDLFKGVGGPSTNEAGDVKRTGPRRRPALPKDLPTAIKYLDNGELDRLLRAATDEAKRRGRLPPSLATTPRNVNPGSGEPSLKQAPSTSRPTHQRPTRTAAIPLTRGQVNAVRAAFKAGVTPARIARQFGLSQSDVSQGSCINALSRKRRRETSALSGRAVRDIPPLSGRYVG